MSVSRYSDFQSTSDLFIPVRLFLGFGTLSGKMLLVRIIENN